MPEAPPPPRVVVLGASGQVGRFILHRLGQEALACARNPPAHPAGTAQAAHRLDLWSDHWPSPAPCLISAGPLDACVAWLQRSGPGAIRRIVALSSMSAVHKANSVSLQEQALAARLRASEEALQLFAQAHDIRCSILRPTLIWGSGLDHSLTPFAHDARRRGLALIPTGASGLRQPVHADDLAALCTALSGRGDCAALMPVGGAEQLPLADMLQRVARAVGARSLRLPVPAILLRWAGDVGMRIGSERAAAWSRAFTDQVVDDDQAWRCAGLTPRGFDPDAASFRVPDRA
jgi:uncharacterized protein YbjT (DUF2867 family)